MSQSVQGRTASAAPAGDDWTVVAADRLESIVGTVRDNTTTRLVVVARALVFGLIAAVLGIAVLLLLAIALIRVLDVYLGNTSALALDEPGRSVWVADAIVGGIFVLPGLFLLRSASSQKKEAR
jgi:hypothetical protein